jgi:hypothetical protein
LTLVFLELCAGAVRVSNCHQFGSPSSNVRNADFD